jgi:oxaloacetate decarboxylase gamma subunit
MDSILIAQGLDLMLYGMGTVFTFLTVLVVITSTMSALVNRIATEDVVATSAPSADSVEPRLATIIQAAIDQHRGRK